MDTNLQFSHIITSENELRDIIGRPGQLAANKALDHLDEHSRAFIARSPFLLIASSDAQGRTDISPKGDPPGFVQVLDDHTFAIPERPGNRRADTFSNVLQHPQVGILFLIPGRKETLRVNGTAQLVRDEWLRERMIVQGKLPILSLVVTVEEVFFHCTKCVVRSGLWDDTQWPDHDGLSSLAKVVVDQSKLDLDVEWLETDLREDEKSGLY